MQEKNILSQETKYKKHLFSQNMKCIKVIARFMKQSSKHMIGAF